MQYTTNYSFKKPEDNEAFDQQNHANWNIDQIDAALTPTADPAQVPTGNGPGKLVQWVSWFANRIKMITGKANWWDAPDTTLAAAKSHIDAAAPHSGHALASDLAAHLADKANPHQVTAAQTGALVSVDGVSNAGGNIDLVAGANIAITPDNTNKRITIAGTGTWLNADKVDNIHFRVLNGNLQYSTDGSVWYDVGVIANAVRTVDFFQSNATANTWYTVLDVTGLGVLTRISFQGVSVSNSYLMVRITIDGTSYIVDPSVDSYSRALRDDAKFIDLMTHVKFDSSLKVEVSHNYSSSVHLAVTIDYGLV